MVELLEKKLGDLVKELQSRREQLRRELTKVEGQLELLNGLVKSSTSIGRPAAPVSKTVVAEKPKSNTAQKQMPSSDKAKKPASTQPEKRNRGRPRKDASTSHAKKAAGRAGRKSKSDNGKTLKEELIAIAKANGGSFSIKDAALQMVKSGRYFTTERAAANIHSAIANAKESIVRDSKQRGVYKVKV